MNTNSNTYTVIYATILVVFVAAVLAIVSTSLKDMQTRNVEVETKSTILSSVNLTQGAKDAEDKNAFIENIYIKGEKQAGEAFGLDLKKQMDQLNLGQDAQLPIYRCRLDSGEELEILSIYGNGLWGPIWGYIAVNNDYSTIYGATFAHKGETPGLGAEIATPSFQNQLVGKQIFDTQNYVGISIVKGGNSANMPHQVDAISGGTITCNGLNEAINLWLEAYRPYLENKRKGND